MAESKYGAELRKRGFLPTTEYYTSEELRSMDGLFGKSANDVKKFMKEMADEIGPNFSRFDGFTQAITEDGEEWICEDDVDLRDIGFVDFVADVFSKAVRNQELN